MTVESDFTRELEHKVSQQLQAQRVGYLLGAGSSYLDGVGYPLTFELWDLVKSEISDPKMRAEIQSKLDVGATGIEQALDLLDDGGAADSPYRHLVTEAISNCFIDRTPSLEIHATFVTRLSQRKEPSVKVFSLNYDPLVERAAEFARVRVWDGFLGVEHAFFAPEVFAERIGQIRGSHKGRQFDETVMPIHLLKLHGSLGWYECPQMGVRRGPFGSTLPIAARRLMVPPQRRKATDTVFMPYAHLWSAFRGCLVQDAKPINRLACFGYGFEDEHVNAIIEGALARTDFTLLIFTKCLSNTAWERWSAKMNTVVVTETRCSLKGMVGPGHDDLWRFERLCKEI